MGDGDGGSLGAPFFSEVWRLGEECYNLPRADPLHLAFVERLRLPRLQRLLRYPATWAEKPVSATAGAEKCVRGRQCNRILASLPPRSSVAVAERARQEGSLEAERSFGNGSKHALPVYLLQASEGLRADVVAWLGVRRGATKTATLLRLHCQPSQSPALTRAALASTLTPREPVSSPRGVGDAPTWSPSEDVAACASGPRTSLEAVRRTADY